MAIIINFMRSKESLHPHGKVCNAELCNTHHASVATAILQEHATMNASRIDFMY